MAGVLPFGPSGAPLGGGIPNMGFPISGTPAGASGIGGLTLPIVSSSRPTSAFGLNSFVSVVAHYVCISNPAPEDGASAQNASELGPGMLVFSRDTSPAGAKPTRKVKARYDGITVGPNTAEFKELTQLNKYLEVHSGDYASAEEVLAEWRMTGVIKNETAPTQVDYGRAAQSRILNLVVSHRVSLLNYWISSRIVQSQKLWILVVQKKNGTNASGVAKTRWELVPWTSTRRSCPSIKDLLGESDDVGAALYVGKSSDQSYAQHGFGKTNVKFSETLVKQGLMSQLEINLGI